MSNFIKIGNDVFNIDTIRTAFRRDSNGQARVLLNFTDGSHVPIHADTADIVWKVLHNVSEDLTGLLGAHE